MLGADGMNMIIKLSGDSEENHNQILQEFIKLSRTIKINSPIVVSSEIEKSFGSTFLIEKNDTDDKIYLSHTGKLIFETIKKKTL